MTPGPEDEKVYSQLGRFEQLLIRISSFEDRQGAELGGESCCSIVKLGLQDLHRSRRRGDRDHPHRRVCAPSELGCIGKCGRSGGRDGVACVVLGRGADEAKVDHWLREAAPVDGYIGFAIGRSIWGDPLKGWIDGAVSREDAASQIAESYLRFIDVYAAAAAPAR